MIKLAASFGRRVSFLLLTSCQVVFPSEFLSLPNLSPESAVLEDEGFLWTKNLIIFEKEKKISFEESHTDLYQVLNEFQIRLRNLKLEDVIESFKNVIFQDLNLSESNLMEIFKNLNSPFNDPTTEKKITKKISDVLSDEEILKVLFKKSKKVSKIFYRLDDEKIVDAFSRKKITAERICAELKKEAQNDKKILKTLLKIKVVRSILRDILFQALFQEYRNSQEIFKILCNQALSDEKIVHDLFCNEDVLDFLLKAVFKVEIICPEKIVVNEKIVEALGRKNIQDILLKAFFNKEKKDKDEEEILTILRYQVLTNKEALKTLLAKKSIKNIFLDACVKKKKISTNSSEGNKKKDDKELPTRLFEVLTNQKILNEVLDQTILRALLAEKEIQDILFVYVLDEKDRDPTKLFGILLAKLLHDTEGLNALFSEKDMRNILLAAFLDKENITTKEIFTILFDKVLNNKEILKELFEKKGIQRILLEIFLDPKKIDTEEIFQVLSAKEIKESIASDNFLKVLENKEVIKLLLGNKSICGVLLKAFLTQKDITGILLEIILENQDIIEILESNLMRLQYKNACIASFEYVSEETPIGKGFCTLFEQETIPLSISGTVYKPIIFLSGIGNELIRILQINIFKKFEFIIFHHGDTNQNSISITHFQKVLENLYTIGSSKDSIKTTEKRRKTTEECKIDVDRYENIRAKGKINRENVKNRANFENLIMEYSRKINSEENKRKLYEIPVKIINAWEEGEKNLELTFGEFKDKFLDSEQALRYFLFEHIKVLLRGISVTSQGLLVLNIHSVMDPCKHCTNALLLESLLRVCEPFQKDSKDLVLGFFQKYYQEKAEHMPEVFILVSSQKLETKGGIGRRLLAGRGTNPTATIKNMIPIESSTRLFFRYNGPDVERLFESS
ncbi:hypothetical protein H0X06_04520 [Candidatus Dependentiae bacterium]|nr:hypothetical protein [Candidatus Dependentiae bacterium]